MNGTDAASLDQSAPTLRLLRKGERPMCLIHPVGGSTACYASLVSALSGDLNVQAIEAGEDLGIGADFDSLVTEYAGLLRNVFLNRELVLGGWSMGATLALSLAAHPTLNSRLRGLVLIDPYGPDPLASTVEDRTVGFFQDLLGVAIPQADLNDLPVGEASRINLLSDRLCRRGLLDPAMQGPGLLRAYDRYARLASVLDTRQPPNLAALPCPTLAIEAKTELATPVLVRLPPPESATLIRLPGTHHSIVSGKDGAATAQRISAFLNTLNPTEETKCTRHVKEDR